MKQHTKSEQHPHPFAGLVLHRKSGQKVARRNTDEANHSLPTIKALVLDPIALIPDPPALLPHFTPPPSGATLPMDPGPVRRDEMARSGPLMQPAGASPTASPAAPGSSKQPPVAGHTGNQTGELTIGRITATLLGTGPQRIPTEDFWNLFRVWRQTLANAGHLKEKTDRGWVIDIALLSEESLARACHKVTFRTETTKAVEQAITTLVTVFAHDPAKLEILSLLAGRQE